MWGPSPVRAQRRWGSLQGGPRSREPGSCRGRRSEVCAPRKGQPLRTANSGPLPPHSALKWPTTTSQEVGSEGWEGALSPGKECWEGVGASGRQGPRDPPSCASACLVSPESVGRAGVWGPGHTSLPAAGPQFPSSSKVRLHGALCLRVFISSRHLCPQRAACPGVRVPGCQVQNLPRARGGGYLRTCCTCQCSPTGLPVRVWWPGPSPSFLQRGPGPAHAHAGVHAGCRQNSHQVVGGPSLGPLKPQETSRIPGCRGPPPPGSSLSCLPRGQCPLPGRGQRQPPLLTLLVGIGVSFQNKPFPDPSSL